MKSKLKNREQQIEELEEIDESDVDVEAIGPSISTGKKGKVALILISSIFITLIIYLFFFSGEEEVVNLEPVVQTSGTAVAQKEDVESSFDIAQGYDLIEGGSSGYSNNLPVPEIPALPEIPQGVISKDSDMGQIIQEAEQQKREQEKLQQQDLAPPSVQILPQNNNQPDISNINGSPPQIGSSLPGVATNPVANLDPRYSPIVVFSGAAQGSPTRGVGYEKNIIALNENSIDQLQKSNAGLEATFIEDRSTTIAQGKLLTAVLETAINTELPGFVRGIVSRDVYGESGNNVLIPRGSRLFGSYSSQVQRGQARVDISWTRLIRPDGVDLSISFNASDQFGRSGIGGEIDNKFSSIVTNSILTSILTIGGVAIAEQMLDGGATTTTTDPTNGTSTSTGSASNQAIYDVSRNIVDTVGGILRDQINTDPVITVPQGTRITVVVNSDIRVPKMSN